MNKHGTKTDAEMKAQLLRVAKSGAPRPAANSELGRALTAFTTKPPKGEKVLDQRSR
jgi:hypothetical protein